MREAREPTHFETRPTDHVGEVVAVLWVIEDKIRASTAIAEGTKLSAFLPGVPKDDALARGYDDYVLTGSAGKSEGYHGYTFAKPKTSSQKDTPWRSTPRTMEIDWPNWLRSLYGGRATRSWETEAGLAGADVTSNKKKRVDFEDRYELIPGMRLRTAVMVEEYLSPTKWEKLQTEDGPVPTRVRYYYKGTSLDLDCIHDDVTIPSQSTGFIREAGFGMQSGPATGDGSQFFPRTTWLSWRPFVLSDDQEFENGVWRRKRVRVTQVPPLPEAIRFA